MEKPKECTPKCEFFRCTQKAMRFEPGGVYCRLGDDPCEGYICKYCFCLRNRLLSNGMCGMTMKRVTAALEIPPESVEGIAVKGKLQKRIREKELF